MNNLLSDELNILKRGLKELNLDDSDYVLSKFQCYLEILYEYKNIIHLISKRDYLRVSLKHFLPSLMVIKFLKDETFACDIGAGAGFPSLPVKILRPEIKFTLFESKGKKANFLEYLIKELKLFGVEVVNRRAEGYHKMDYELALIRAAGKIKMLGRVVYNLLKNGGRAVFYKSPRVDKELNEAQGMMRRYKFILSVERLLIPVSCEPISLVFLQKSET